jgi:hypothetical protein
MAIPEAVRALERDLRGIFGARLQSLSIYGTPRHAQGEGDAHRAHAHASPAAHGHDHPPTTTLAVVESMTHDDLRGCARRIEAWHDAGLATPLLIAAREFERSLDAFPLEFGAIVANHVVVAGGSPFASLKVDPADVRRACEVQARSHLLHLREGYLETRGRADALSVLIVQSAGAFAALVASVARLEGHASDEPAAAARYVERLLNLPGGAVTEVAKLVGVQEISSADAERLFAPYLDAVERLVNYVDGWKSGR